jgi:predicted DNA-binding transcriptional regulator AlpA
MTLWRKINEPNSSFPKPVYRNRVRYWYADEIADYWSKEAGHDAAA